MILGEINSIEEVAEMERGGTKWGEVCLGSFYIKPNYPGRSSHVCNGGFLVTEAARNRGVGRLMGEGYLEWAPKLGYTYSVFNLVYETNVASCRIWDALGFKRIGRIKDCGNLRSYPNELVDAIIYGRDLGPEGEDFISEERFDKIRYYLKHGKYPNGADRAEKSRLRSAATHYKLLPPEDGDPEGEERLMLKDKEVVSDPQRQYEIARSIHASQHGGINKTTATIAEKYHWVRIKETVSLVIKNCAECKESSATGVKPPGSDFASASASTRAGGFGGGYGERKAAGGYASINDQNSMIERLVDFTDLEPQRSHHQRSQQQQQQRHDVGHMVSLAAHHHQHQPMHQAAGGYDLPLDPQIISQHAHTGYGQTGHPAYHDGATDEGDAAGYGLDLGPAGVPDTRLATERHVREHDEPMEFVQEDAYDSGGAGSACADFDAVKGKEEDGDLAEFERGLLGFEENKERR
ncbi:MAG: hypothetical protein LQ351_006710 [Letrouitia transgressa]|nr:MAG: hypothetical protein LQ351_006710 [Letrouitia transgressa]